MNPPPEDARATRFNFTRVRWRDSLFVRVLVLCAILLLCLFGSVLVITQFYLEEAAQEMRAQTQGIADSIVLEFKENPDIELPMLESHVKDFHSGFDIDLQAQEGLVGEPSVTHEVAEDGRVLRVARVPVRYGNRNVLVTARVTVAPQTEVLRAFRNKYMIGLTVTFVVALGLMLYFIARALRPLTDLAGRCADVSAGKLDKVDAGRAVGEIRALADTFNDMIEALRETEVVEAKLRQAQRLSALGNLAAGIAHDVRNPLNAIKLLSSHAMDGVEDGPDSPKAKPLRTIRAEVDRLEDIVSNFLSLAKETTLSPELQPIDDLLGECVRLFHKDAEARGVRITTNLRAGNRKIMLDPKHFTRAILNVLVNAIEASPAGGHVQLSSRLSDRDCQIEIRDEGPGLPEDIVERAFDPYFTTKAGGTGLGLSITRGIVEEHHGTIEIYSLEGQGCQALISLPLKEASQ